MCGLLSSELVSYQGFALCAYPYLSPSSYFPQCRLPFLFPSPPLFLSHTQKHIHSHACKQAYVHVNPRSRTHAYTYTARRSHISLSVSVSTQTSIRVEKQADRQKDKKMRGQTDSHTQTNRQRNGMKSRGCASPCRRQSHFHHSTNQSDNPQSRTHPTSTAEGPQNRPPISPNRIKALSVPFSPTAVQLPSYV